MTTGGTHSCQLHHDENALARNVLRYVKGGLDQGSSVTVVAGEARRQAINRFLAESEVLSKHLLTLIDSRSLLARFMRDDKPDRHLFRDALCPILDAAAARGNGTARIYGEMVNDLWWDGNAAGAIRLEELWNELLQEYEFSLFCGYVLDAFNPDSYSSHLEDVCLAHTHIAPTPDEDEVRMAIDDACQHVLGIHLSSLLRHSQSADDKWHVRLPLSRRAILWLKSNTASRLTQVLRIARESYTKRNVCVSVK